MPEEKPRANVIDLTDRRLERVPHIRFRADLAEGVVVQTIHHPEIGNVHVGFTLSEVLKAVEGLITEGSKLATSRWASWASHIAGDEDYVGAKGRADAFVRMWRVVRPDPRAEPPASQDMVYARASNLATQVCAGAPASSAEEEANNLVSHLSYDGVPLCRSSCELIPVPGHFLLPWDTL